MGHGVIKSFSHIFFSVRITLVLLFQAVPFKIVPLQLEAVSTITGSICGSSVFLFWQVQPVIVLKKYHHQITSPL
jgi:hypothetical protein